jgi:hypothetical protein
MDDLFTLDMPNKINENEPITDNDIKKFFNLDTEKLYQEIKKQADSFNLTNHEGGSINISNKKVKKIIINNFDIGNNNTLKIFKTKY